MATAAETIVSGRWDLRDPNTNQYTDPELLDYLNRGLVQLDSALSAVSSDLLFTEDTGNTTLAEDDNFVDGPSRCLKVRQLWIGTDQLTDKVPDYIYYKRQINGSATGRPNYFTQLGTSIAFEFTADQDYDLVIHYDRRHAALVGATTMPYDGDYDQPLREAMVLLAKRRQEYDVNLDAVLFDFFMEAAMAKTIKRRHKRKPYRLGF